MQTISQSFAVVSRVREIVRSLACLWRAKLWRMSSQRKIIVKCFAREVAKLRIKNKRTKAIRMKPAIAKAFLLFFLWYMFFPAVSSARETTIPANSFENGTLNARVLDSNVDVDFNNSISTIKLKTKIENNMKKNVRLSFVVLKEGKWTVLQDLGELAPGKTAYYAVSQEFEWDTAVKDYEYAIVGDDGKKYYGYAFSLQNEWAEFVDKNFKDALVQGYLVAVPIVTFILACALFLAMEVAFKRKGFADVIENEYTLKTLFLPILKGRPLREKIADVVLNPFFWLIEIICSALFLSIIFAYTITSSGYDLGQYVFVIGGVAAVSTPILYVIAVWLADYYEREPLRFVSAAFFWGFFAAFTAFILNTLFGGVIEVLFEGMEGKEFGVLVLSTALIAPIVEEIVKGLGVTILGGHHEMDDATDGLVYGFAIGAGFAFIENWFYFAAEAQPLSIGIKAWIALLLYRSFFNTIAHGCFTAAIGGVIGFMKTKSSLRKYAQLGAVPGVMIAIMLHISFNVGAILDTIAVYQWNFNVFIFNPMFVAALGVAFVIVFAIAAMQTKRRIESELIIKELVASIRSK